MSLLQNLPSSFALPKDCPFSITQLYRSSDHQTSLWLIRENDKFGEYPHIYAKICPGSNGAGLIVLSDVGCGTETANSEFSHDDQIKAGASGPARWNLRTFLTHTINPNEHLPYLVMTTHCHYDHILGLQHFLPDTKDGNAANFQILASTHAQSFIQPYHNLQRHSLCTDTSTTAPDYASYVTIWAKDQQDVVYHPTASAATTASRIPTNITIFLTPGHSPDSLSWYDADSRLLCVADTFYSKHSKLSTSAPWGKEVDMPTIFSRFGSVVVWWRETGRLLKWVREKNEKLLGGNRVKFAAGHVDADMDGDAEEEIMSARGFVAAVLREEVPGRDMADGGRWFWDWALEGSGREKGKYSLLAPLELVERARKEIGGEEFAKEDPS